MDTGAIFYPLLLACAIIVVMLVVGVGFSYLGLLAFDAQIRTCPNCHKRGAGAIVATEIIDSQSNTTWNPTRSFTGAFAGRPRLFEVTEENFEDRYECKNCGHKWTKAGKEVKRTRISKRE